MMRNYEDLANAIILQAVDDYRAALKAQKIHPDQDGEVRKLERFFRSEWYSVLTSVDGNGLIQALKKEAGL